ncbi:LrgB family protein [Phosphitispora fastidiosa]|uniref:LrgB family protein n=1 Tax=Phosphitispora fastidiosa TaxID=2837202 RepID=UPI001E30A1A1|nr:LrgB family protein [Phosphitispora fastidiosa]MBU7005290.1 putative murein hydrolase (TIGR00659 family) [Phosphitispora fastidiosa]
MLNSLLREPLIQITVTLVVYLLVNRLYRRFHFFLFNPLILATVIVIYILHYAKIDYAVYSQGGDMITFLLGPATVALGVPLYKQLPNIKSNLKGISVGVITGSITAIVSTIFIAKALGAGKETLLSIAAKSTTMPIAIGITGILGGNDKIIVMAVAITGIFGGVIGAEVMKLAGIKSKIAVGIGIGTASHAGGTSRAIQIGETEGSMSGAAIVLTGLVTALLAPYIVKWLI